MKIHLRLISLWLCFGSLYLLIQRLFYKDEHDILRVLTIVIDSWLYVFWAVVFTEASNKKLNIFLYLLLVVFLSISVEYYFIYIAPNIWKDNTMAFFEDIFYFTLIWVSSILASKLMIGGYRRLKNVVTV